MSIVLPQNIDQPSRTLSKTKIALLAGEQSGDLLGSSLASSLKTRGENIELIGVCGEKMKKEGVSAFFSIDKLETMGFYEVVLGLPHLAQAFFKIRNRLLDEKPDAIVTIDYPDFHLLLARSLRRAGYKGKIIQYVSPSIWAWRKGRIATLESYFDAVLGLFPFESKAYFESFVKFHYVGHPLVHEISPSSKTREKLIAIFPGSRSSVIQKNLPIQLEAARHLFFKMPHYGFAISVARKEFAPMIEALARKASIPIHYEMGETRALMKRVDAAIATSGTVTLELALSLTPTVVTYPVTGLNYLLGKYLFRIRLPHYCIVNLLGEKTIFPEFIGRKLDPQGIARALEAQIYAKESVRKECLSIRKNLLGETDPSAIAAETILEILE